MRRKEGVRSIKNWKRSRSLPLERMKHREKKLWKKPKWYIKNFVSEWCTVAHRREYLKNGEEVEEEPCLPSRSVHCIIMRPSFCSWSSIWYLHRQTCRDHLGEPLLLWLLQRFSTPVTSPTSVGAAASSSSPMPPSPTSVSAFFFSAVSSSSCDAKNKCSFFFFIYPILTAGFPFQTFGTPYTSNHINLFRDVQPTLCVSGNSKAFEKSTSIWKPLTNQ